jgi:hypothetical protein
LAGQKGRLSAPFFGLVDFLVEAAAFNSRMAGQVAIRVEERWKPAVRHHGALRRVPDGAD